jgi:hypothetical protein
MRILAFALLLVVAIDARAANISVVPPEGTKPALIAIQGNFEFEDADKFTKSVAPFQNAIVVFESDGGNLIAGLHIGRLIHQKKFSTFVPANLRCASACAIAWLGGVRRFMGAGARIGFHAAFDARSKQESGAANALVGAFLKEIGLDYPAVFYITQAPPQSMTWLSMEDAARLGIQVTLLESPTARPRPSEGSARPSDVQMKNRALSIVAALFRKWSESNETDWIAGIYAEKVSYYGSVADRDAVVADKIRFTERWPERRYRLRFESFDIQCDEASARCKVEGIVDWQTRNSERSETRSGAANFVYVIAFSPNAFRILSETGGVLRQQPATERPVPPQRRENAIESDTGMVEHRGGQ